MTIQVPNTIKIACSDKRIFASVGTLKGKIVKSYVDVNDENYSLLKLLDVFKYYNQIPDLDANAAILLLGNKLKNLMTI